MPPPHLHPRSRMTSSLFATTVFASFFVVGLPHILPCPAPRVARADGQIVQEDGTVVPARRRRRRRSPDDGAAASSSSSSQTMTSSIPEVQRGADGTAQFSGMVDDGKNNSAIQQRARRTPRECPVPKPPGVIGELLGFRNNEPKQ